MDATKKKSNINKIIEWLLFAYLAIFPFGQLLRWDLNASGFRVTLHLADFIVGIIFLATFFIRQQKNAVFKYLNIFYLALLFSWTISLVIFGSKALLGGFYLIRIISYSGLLVAVAHLIQVRQITREFISKLLLTITLVTAVFGWLQYLVLPDLRFLKAIGWDDHLFRLTGTFLDPGYMGIILVFGFILSLTSFLAKKNLKDSVLIAFFALTTAFTYSRASYFALAAGVIVTFLLMKKINWKLPLVLIVGCLSLLLLPRPSSEGVHLERLYSVFLRVENYRETLSIFGKSPVFGVGFNNLCLARMQNIGETYWRSHSCSGADSSLLFLLATGGIISFIIFITFIIVIFKQMKKSIYGSAFFGCGAALLTHSFFTNSLFYPWVMSLAAILLGTALEFEKIRGSN